MNDKTIEHNADAFSIALNDLEIIQRNIWSVLLQLIKSKDEHGIIAAQMQDARDKVKTIIDGPLTDAEYILTGNNPNSEAL